MSTENTAPRFTAISNGEFAIRLYRATKRTAEGGAPFWLAFVQLPDSRVEAGVRDGTLQYKTVTSHPVKFDGARAGMIRRAHARKILQDVHCYLMERCRD